MVDYLLNKPKDNVVFVRISTAIALFYGWKTKDLTALTNVSAADLTALGHVAASLLPNGALTIFRASAPKPGRAKKTINNNPSAAQQKNVSTFFATGALQAAIAAGWTFEKGAKKVNLTKNARTTTAIAELSNGLSYAFPMNSLDFETYKGDLGLTDLTSINTAAELDRLIRGTKNPRPGKAQRIVTGGGKKTNFFSDGQESILAQAGWSIIDREVVA